MAEFFPLSSGPSPPRELLSVSPAIGFHLKPKRKSRRCGRVNVQARDAKRADALDPICYRPPAVTSRGVPDTIRPPSLFLSQSEATAIASAATLSFALLAVDLLAEHRQLALVDVSVHCFIAEHTDSFSRSFFGGKLLSNAPITVGWLGWAAMAAVVAALPKKPSGSMKAIRHLGIAAIIYVLGGGSVIRGDPFLVSALKHFFHRVRPSPVHSTFAFPSGHTTAATFMVGTLLFILLPALIEAASATNPSCRPFLRSVLGRGLVQWRWPLWATAVASTATGRVLADAHWTTDVMAGACPGSALVGGVALLCAAVDAVLEKEK